MKQLSMVLVILGSLALGCSNFSNMAGGGQAETYTSEPDKFSVVFPAGSGEVKSEINKGGKYLSSGVTYSKSYDNRSDNYRSYEVQVYKIDSPPHSSTERRTTLLFGLNGWDEEPGTEVKDVTINGEEAVDSIRTVEVGPAKMSFREVCLYSDKSEKLYVLQIAAVKKELLTAKEANDFVNSFKMK